MTRDDLAEWAKGLSCEELAKRCRNVDICYTLNVPCNKYFTTKPCNDITAEDWRIALGSIIIKGENGTTRDILEDSCKHKTCEELADMCNGRGWHTLRCPAYNASCPDGLAEIDDSGQIGCDSVTPEDWQKVLGEIPEKNRHA